MEHTCYTHHVSPVLQKHHYSYCHIEIKASLPWVHLRKMEADTPPPEGLPHTKSTTSLFNSDMTGFNAGHTSFQQGDRIGPLRPTCQLFPGLIVLFSGQVEPVALATGYQCGTIQSDYRLATNWRVGMTSTFSQQPVT